MNFDTLAKKSIAGLELDRQECKSVLESCDADLMDLLAAAFRVRRRFCGMKVHIHVLTNARSGLCPEDCNYCSQSVNSNADFDKYPLIDREALVAGAQRAKEAKARRFCIVTSGRSPSARDLDQLTDAIREIKETVDIGICCSLGLLDGDQARRLREAGVEQLNHNLNTSERFYPEICSTHTFQDRLDTLEAARGAGLKLCTGAIFGQGETHDDIIDVSLALRRLDPQSVPVNFLHPIPGTLFEQVNYLTPGDCLRSLCLMRMLCPTQEIRVAGGREYHLRQLQPLALYPANSLFVSGYLTTPGQGYQEAWQMIEDMGFEIEEHHRG